MTRTFVLGIDGGSWRILNNLDLPAFERLTKSGTTGTLRSTLPPITYPAWKCYSTGKNPGKLDVFGFINLDREREENRQNDATHFDSAELWDYLSSEGKRVGVVNMPSTYPPHKVNGIIIAGPNSGESGLVKPEDREEEIMDRGYVPMSNGHRLALQSGGDTTISAAEELIESRFDVSRQLLNEEEFDFFNLTIYCTDPVQHHFWEGEEVAETYRILDRELGTLLNQLEEDDEEWNVVVISDHGFRSINGGAYVDTWLQQEGFLRQKKDISDSAEPLLSRIGVNTQNTVRIVRVLGLEGLVGKLPDSFTSRVNEQLPSQGGVAVVDSVDWERSDAMFLMGGIYVLNQERRGEILDELEGALGSFTIDGEAVFDEVYRTDEVYSGAYTGAAPDLIPISNDFKLLGFSGDGSLFDPDNSWIAAHEMEGLFVGSGPSFGANGETNLQLYDLMPTVLHSLGSPVPTDCDNEVPEAFLKDDAVSRRREPLRREESESATDEDREQMEENLRQLGYLE